MPGPACPRTTRSPGRPSGRARRALDHQSHCTGRCVPAHVQAPDRYPRVSLRRPGWASRRAAARWPRTGPIACPICRVGSGDGLCMAGLGAAGLWGAPVKTATSALPRSKAPRVLARADRHCTPSRTETLRPLRRTSVGGRAASPAGRPPSPHPEAPNSACRPRVASGPVAKHRTNAQVSQRPTAAMTQVEPSQHQGRPFHHSTGNGHALALTTR